MLMAVTNLHLGSYYMIVGNSVDVFYSQFYHGKNGANNSSLIGLETAEHMDVLSTQYSMFYIFNCLYTLVPKGFKVTYKIISCLGFCF